MSAPQKITPAPPPVYDCDLSFPKLAFLVKTIAQIAFRAFFAIGTTLMVASVLPHATILAGTAIGTSFLSAFFFQPEIFSKPLSLTALQPLLTGRTPSLAPIRMPQIELPAGAPRGIRNRGSTCWLNADLQFLRTIQPVHAWLTGAEVSEEFHPFRDFYLSYEQAVAQNNRSVPASVSPLRRILSEWNPAIRAEGSEEDAPEGLTAIFDRLPDPLRIDVQVTNHYHARGLPPVPPTIRPERKFPFIELVIHEPYSSIPRMLEHYFTEENLDGTVEIEGHRYPRARQETRFVQAPQNLVFSIKRFQFEQARTTILSRFPLIKAIAAKIWPELEGRTVKSEAPVQVPHEITIAPVEGAPQIYRIRACLCHHGSSANSGHYTAYAIGRDGLGYYCNDEMVTRRDLNDWPLEQVYLLHYERVQDQPD